MSKSKRHHQPTTESAETDLRIIGGALRGRRLAYHGDPGTRPMKHRVREAIFNLISTEAEGRHAVDLFAGTGALALEALSRGAATATLIERHVPTARVIRENISRLALESRCELLETSAFVWARRDLPAVPGTTRQCELPRQRPWLVFVSPPYAFYFDRQQQMVTLVADLMEHAPAGSTLVVEADQRFDFQSLPGGVRADRHSPGWDVRSYPPAVVGVWRTPSPPGFRTETTS